MVSSEYLSAVLEVIREVGGVKDLDPEQDFYDAGVTSVQALPLLMELEARFEVTIPDERFILARRPLDICALITEVKEA
ncbi:MAG: acyl carrier protein [Acidobacteriales bacterium]|nr:acyl carrier protein [Terriglobales bacterium]